MEPENVIKEYTNGEITITWEPAACIHSTMCWQKLEGLPKVFNPKNRPWITMEHADSETIIKHVGKCPSGALKYYRNNEQDAEPKGVDNVVEILANGPLLVHGDIVVKDSLGNKTRKNKVTAFCRCGASSNKPYCDGSHTIINFQG